MKNIFLFVLLVQGIILCQNGELKSNSLLEETSITGIVIDANNSSPLEYVNVYISGTTIGTTTNKDGSFFLSHVPIGISKLVASMIGYKAAVLTYDTGKNDEIELEIKLRQVVYDFTPIDVEAKEAGEWRDQYEKFEKLFLGTDEFTAKCSIENKYKIDFKEDDNYFSATCKEPLIIVNNALGYKIYCLLNSFEIDKEKEVVSYLIYPHFIEKIPSTTDSLLFFRKNRLNAYLGSLRHLLQTLINPGKDFLEEGFELRYFGGTSILYRVNSASEIVYPDTVSGNFRLVPQKGADKRNKNSNGITVKYNGSIRKGVSKILAVNREGIEFDKRGFFLYQQEYYTSGVMGLDRISTLLPNNWKMENQ